MECNFRNNSLAMGRVPLCTLWPRWYPLRECLRGEPWREDRAEKVARLPLAVEWGSHARSWLQAELAAGRAGCGPWLAVPLAVASRAVRVLPLAPVVTLVLVALVGLVVLVVLAVHVALVASVVLVVQVVLVLLLV